MAVLLLAGSGCRMCASWMALSVFLAYIFLFLKSFKLNIWWLYRAVCSLSLAVFDDYIGFLGFGFLRELFFVATAIF